MRPLVLLLFLLLSVGYCKAQPLTAHPFSTNSECFSPCCDTIVIFKKATPYDIGVILPSWLPIVNSNYVGVVEGHVESNTTDGADGPHVSDEDLPFYHYSHDIDFDVVPDKTPDNRYTNYLPYLIYKKKEGNDTVLDGAIHCEWECGLGMANRINPLAQDNDAGRSGGFCSAGHQLGETIWNWPASGDWTHVEGHYVWDRGHPPSEAELHPVRFMAFKRALPEQISIGDSSVKFATRIDIFASGDGGALMNNRYNAAPYIKRVNMSSKDYEFTTTVDLPRPSPTAHLHFKLSKHGGDSFSAPETIDVNDDSGTIHILIPWKTKNANDLEVYARTILVYWDEGRGLASSLPVDIYKVKLTGLHFKHLNELFSKAEIRMFVNVGSDWVFVNDLLPRKGKILTRGLGETYKHKWALNREFIVSVPRGKTFRVFMSGWEADGIDLLFGKLFDPNSMCDKKIKRLFKNAIFSFSKMYMRGCLDDPFGQTSKLHSFDNLGKTNTFSNSPQSGKNDDPCPCSKYPLKDRVFLNYTIEKVN